MIDQLVGTPRLIDDEVAADQRAVSYRTALEADHALLRAGADSMLDPQIVLHAVRDATGLLLRIGHSTI